jgi:hypothetical protein
MFASELVPFGSGNHLNRTDELEEAVMNIKHFRAYLVVCSLVVVLQPLQPLAQENSDAPKAGVQHAPAERDGQGDFDFEIGTWRTHLRRLLHPLTGSTTWVEYEGTSVVRKIWNGRANVVELEADGPQGHFEGLNLRLYHPQSHQWSLNFANSSDGALSQPTVGGFDQGRGEFYDQETVNGRAVLVRFVISDITENSCRFEQAFSTDGGKTWEVNWIATDTRVNDGSDKSIQPASAEPDSQRDFDFEIGSWKIHLKRLDGRLSGSTTWVEFDGISFTQKVWNGRAQIEQFETDSAAGGHIEGLTLRLYNPQSHQWSLYWANSKNGILDPPQIGEFKNGRGEFYAQDTWNGKAVFVRFVWTNTTTNVPHFEQSYSDDGGKTWEVNWITDQTRVADTAH